MKKELLSPVGDKDSLIMAVLYGADAVYLGGKNFGARKYASNFDNKELKQAVAYCHLYGVKIYVTVNTIIYETELKSCLTYINYLYNIGVDAIIVQDIGLIKLIRQYLPQMEIHVSTQTSVHNIEQIKFLESLGVKRVVLAREMSLKDINDLKTNLELEIFIHGALCICYSGQCLLSSQILGRSGNRGECAGLCRILYNLNKDDTPIIKNKYLLSPKELAVFSNFAEIKNSKVISLKIEGRMKSPEYVGYVTKIYRKLLDDPNYTLSEEEIFNLKSLYNRDFTKGYLFHEQDTNLININSSNHQGVIIGDVIKYSNKYITIKLNHQLNQGDAIRLPNNEGMYINFLYNQKKDLINKGLAQDIILIDNKVNLNEIGPVYLTINKELNNIIKKEAKRQIPLTLKVIAQINKPLQIIYKDDIHEVQEIGPLVESAQNAPISKERILQALTKLGNTPFIITEIDENIMDNIFIPISVLNNIRRKLIGKLTIKRTSPKNQFLTINFLPPKPHIRSLKEFKIAVLARNEEQVITLLSLNVDIIYVTDLKIYKKYQNSHIYLKLNRIMPNHPPYQNENLLIGEIGGLKYQKCNNIRTDYFLNVANSSYVNLLQDMNVESITLSPELSDDNLQYLMSNISPTAQVEFIIYGRLELMIMKYNFFKANNLSYQNNYNLEDKQHHKFPITSKNNTILYSPAPINLINKIPLYQKMGINTFRIDLFEEDSETIKNLINHIRKVIN